MKHEISKNAEGLEVKISSAEGKEQKLLEAFRECREGRCSCPTQEYEKLEALHIETSASGISLQLKARSGTQFDQAEIERCLEFTEKRSGPGKPE